MILSLHHVVCLTLSPPAADNGSRRDLVLTLSSGQMLSFNLESTDTVQLFREMTRRSVDVSRLLPFPPAMPTPPVSRPVPVAPWRSTGA